MTNPGFVCFLLATLRSNFRSLQNDTGSGLYMVKRESFLVLLSDAFVSLKPVLVKGPRKLIYGRVISLGFNGFTKGCVFMGPAFTSLGISCIINLQAILYGWIKAPLVRFVGNNFAFRVRPLYVLLGEKQVTHNVRADTASSDRATSGSLFVSPFFFLSGMFRIFPFYYYYGGLY